MVCIEIAEGKCEKVDSGLYENLTIKLSRKDQTAAVPSDMAF